MKLLTASLLLIGFFPLMAVAADLTVDQKKELTVFGMKAMGLSVGVADVKNVLSIQEIEQMVATGLNLNSLLCAQITAIRALQVKSTYEVTCIAYRGGTAQKSYVVDSLKGVAFVP
jgi:hypothetical protein